jgi:hypothetical protein
MSSKKQETIEAIIFLIVFLIVVGLVGTQDFNNLYGGI